MSKLNQDTTSVTEETEATAPTVAEVQAIVFPNLAMEVCGKSTKLLSTIVAPKDGQQFDPNRRYWGFREPTHKSAHFGVTVRPMADALPDHVVIDGVHVALEAGLTSAGWTDQKSNERIDVADEDRRPLVAFAGMQVFPTIGKVTDVVVTITVTKHGMWWIKAIVTFPESPEERAAREQAKAIKRADRASALFD